MKTPEREAYEGKILYATKFEEGPGRYYTVPAIARTAEAYPKSATKDAFDSLKEGLEKLLSL